MSQLATNLPVSAGTCAINSARPDRSAFHFASACLILAIASAALAGWMPLGFSIITVFLFAGPHNWIEARYFLSRMPAHWGPLRNFFIVALLGILLLATLFIAMPFLARNTAWQDHHWLLASSIWNSLLILWVASLIHLRSKHHPIRDWPWNWPIAFALVALAWMLPAALDLSLVYFHPLVAFFFLRNEIKRRRPQWLTPYYCCLAIVPILLAMIWLRLSDAPMLAGQDMLTMRITRHAGAGILTGISSHALVSTHTFLEMLHYSVWIIAIPLIGMRVRPWNISAMPLSRRSLSWKSAMGITIAAGAILVLILWAAFLADYPQTRDIYFAVAIIHVLAEAPFLLRTI